MNRVNNKVILVTGAGSGMGLEEAILLAREGAKVVLTDINEQAVLTAAENIQKEGGVATAFKHNVASEDEWIHVVSETISRFGTIDVLVNNAGISLPVPILDTTIEQWQRTMDINLTGTFLGMKHVIPQMQKNGSGSIVNISSIAGLAGSSGAGAYTASKGGVRMLSKAAAVDFGPQNIRVNSIYPGYIKTPMSEHLFQDDQMLQWFLSKTTLPRVGEASEVALAVLFLASDESSYITGIELPVDGGVTAR